MRSVAVTYPRRCMISVGLPDSTDTHPKVLPEMISLASVDPFLSVPSAVTLPAPTLWEHAPLVAVLLAATVVLVVIALDLRRLKLASGLTRAHRLMGGAFGAAVICLTLVMVVSLEAPAPAMAVDTEAPGSSATPDDEYFEQLQLPTLPTE